MSGAELATQAPQSQAMAAGILNVIAKAASDKTVNVDKLERLLNMQRDTLDREAHASFNRAMQRAQEKIKRVVVDRENTFTKSRYATLATIDRAIRPAYTEEGFSLSFGTDNSTLADYVRVVCDVAHVDGHTKRYFFDLPVDAKGAQGNANKNATQAHGSTVTYGQRYLTKLIFNVVTALDADMDDDDGNGTEQGNRITAEQAIEVKNLVEQLRVVGGDPSVKKFWQWAKVDRAEDIHSGDAFNGIVSSLKDKIKLLKGQQK